MTDEQIKKKQKIEDNPPVGFDHVYIVVKHATEDYGLRSQFYFFNMAESKHGQLIATLLNQYCQTLSEEDLTACHKIFDVLSAGADPKFPRPLLADCYFPRYNFYPGEEEEEKDKEKPELPGCIKQLLDLDDYGVWEETLVYDNSTFCATRPVNIFCLIIS